MSTDLRSVFGQMLESVESQINEILTSRCSLGTSPNERVELLESCALYVIRLSKQIRARHQEWRDSVSQGALRHDDEYEALLKSELVQSHRICELLYDSGSQLGSGVVLPFQVRNRLQSELATCKRELDCWKSPSFHLFSAKDQMDAMFHNMEQGIRPSISPEMLTLAKKVVAFQKTNKESPADWAKRMSQKLADSTD